MTRAFTLGTKRLYYRVFASKQGNYFWIGRISPYATEIEHLRMTRFPFEDGRKSNEDFPGVEVSDRLDTDMESVKLMERRIAAQDREREIIESCAI